MSFYFRSYYCDSPCLLDDEILIALSSSIAPSADLFRSVSSSLPPTSAFFYCIGCGLRFFLRHEISKHTVQHITSATTTKVSKIMTITVIESPNVTLYHQMSVKDFDSSSLIFS